MNRELEEMSKEENIVKWIKGQRISWLGHLERMGDRMPIKIFTQELEGTRQRVLHAARPTRWTFWGICITPSLYHELPCINFQLSCALDYTIGT